jgi:HD-like signal output (HDOD) protein
VVDLNSIVSDIDSLPMLPGSCSRLVSMLNDREVDMNEVADIVRYDDALSMVVLRYANSALHGSANREFNLRESIVRLGSGALLKLVLEMQVGRVFSGGCEAFDLDRKSLWRGSIGGAVAADSLAMQHCPELKDLCFVAGLVRDVGKLVLDSKYGSSYAELVSIKMTSETTFVDAERLAFGTDHAEVGGALCSHWGLPDRIAKAVQYHHDPEAAGDGHDLLVDVVHAADIISLWSGIGIGSDGMQYELANHVKLALKLSRKTAEREIASMWSTVGTIESAMGIYGAEEGEAA